MEYDAIKYKMKVRITSGFYQGWEGTVIDKNRYTHLSLFTDSITYENILVKLSDGEEINTNSSLLEVISE